jgi:hypothetical protein
MQSSELPPAAPTIPQPSAIGSMNHQPQDMHPNAMPWITHFDPDPPARDSAFFRGILGGISICALLAFVAWFGVRHYGWQNPLTSFASYRNSGVADGDLPSPVASSPLASSPVTPAPAQSQVSEPFATPELDATKTNTPDVPPREPASQPSAAQPLKAKMPAPQPVPPQRQTSPASPGPGASETPQPALSNSASSKPESLSDAPAAAPSTQPALTQTRETALNTPVADEPSSSYSAPAATQPTRAGDTGEAQLQLARQYLDGRGRPRNATVASQLLWSAVEKGNSAAEMDLADLYLHGDGVARNCDQARVLLSVASQKGNYEATQKLVDLNRSGCR